VTSFAALGISIPELLEVELCASSNFPEKKSGLQTVVQQQLAGRRWKVDDGKQRAGNGIGSRARRRI
jgi:hypothetical protein